MNKTKQEILDVKIGFFGKRSVDPLQVIRKGKAKMKDPIQNAVREMTLEEWCRQLPKTHLVNRQLAELRAMQETDLESLKRELPPAFVGAYHDKVNPDYHFYKGWNDCIDHLKGHLSPRPEKVEGLGEALEKIEGQFGVYTETVCKAARKYHELSGGNDAGT